MQTSFCYKGSLSFRFWVGFRRENLSGVSFQRSNPPKSPECFHFIPARYGSLRKKHFQKDLKEPPWSQKNARNGQQVRLLTHFVAFFPSLRRKSEISSIEFFTHTNQSPPRFSYCDRTRSWFDSVTYSVEINFNETFYRWPVHTFWMHVSRRNWHQITTDFDFIIAIFQQGQNNLFWLLKWTE